MSIIVQNYSETITVEDGSSFEILNGFLLVYNDKNNQIAAFPPHDWGRVFKDTLPAVEKTPGYEGDKATESANA